MARIFPAYKIKLKKLRKCEDCGFVTRVKMGGKKNCPACLKPYEQVC